MASSRPCRSAAAFQPAAPLRHTAASPTLGARPTRATCRCTASSDSSRGVSRRALLRRLVVLPATTAAISAAASAAALLPSPGAAAAAAAKTSTASLTAPLVQCARVLGAVPRYIDAGAWDKGRTNVNYCTRVLALRRNMRDVAGRLDGDAFYDGMSLTEEVANAMTQLDASLYTPLFIPGDDGEITVEQKRYQKEAREFFKEAADGIDRFLGLVPREDVDAAKAIAAKAKYEIGLEFE